MQFVTEDIDSYVSRKRNNHVHGNHIEIQAISEIFNRPVEIYAYHTGSDFFLSLRDLIWFTHGNCHFYVIKRKKIEKMSLKIFGLYQNEFLPE